MKVIAYTPLQDIREKEYEQRDKTEQINKLQKEVQNLKTNFDEIYKETDKDSLTLDELKELKEKQLNYLCSQSILGYFEYSPINQSGEKKEFLFSYDREAQGNFTDSLLAVTAGALTEIPWTAHVPDTMEVVRVTLTAQDFQQLVGVIMRHKNGNISKFRDELMPQLLAAETKEQVDAVVWE